MTSIVLRRRDFLDIQRTFYKGSKSPIPSLYLEYEKGDDLAWLLVIQTQVQVLQVALGVPNRL